MADHVVYVLECADGSLYTGYTTDLERRVAEHDAGEGAKYTRGRTPVELRYHERFDSKSAAMSREYEIKQLRARRRNGSSASSENRPRSRSVASGSLLFQSPGNALVLPKP